MSAADVPLFAGTEEAMAYGRAVTDSEFRTLVRTYFTTQKAVATAQYEASAQPTDENKNAFSCVAFRLQTLREASEEFLSAAACGAQANPATPEVDTASLSEPVHASPAADPFVTQPSRLTSRSGVSPGEPAEIGHS